MQVKSPDWDRQSGGLTDLTDLNSEFRVNRAVVTEQIKAIQTQLGQNDARMTRIEEDLREKANHSELTPRDTRMDRIENDFKSFMKWWIAITLAMFGAVITAAKLLS